MALLLLSIIIINFGKILKFSILVKNQENGVKSSQRDNIKWVLLVFPPAKMIL